MQKFEETLEGRALLKVDPSGPNVWADGSILNWSIPWLLFYRPLMQPFKFLHWKDQIWHESNLAKWQTHSKIQRIY